MKNTVLKLIMLVIMSAMSYSIASTYGNNAWILFLIGISAALTYNAFN